MMMMFGLNSRVDTDELRSRGGKNMDLWWRDDDYDRKIAGRQQRLKRMAREMGMEPEIPAMVTNLTEVRQSVRRVEKR